MAEPIVRFISRSRIRKERNAAFGAAFAEAVALIGAAKPRTALFAAYIDVAGGEVCVVHVFPDAAAMAATSRARKSVPREPPLIVPAGFEVYGRAPAAAIDQLRREAGGAGISWRYSPSPWRVPSRAVTSAKSKSSSRRPRRPRSRGGSASRRGRAGGGRTGSPPAASGARRR